MSEAEIPLDLSFVLELAKPPSLEEELTMETEIRAVHASQDMDYLKRYGEAMTRQNHDQCRFIAGCLQEIHVLKAKLACATPVKKNTGLSN